MFVIRLAENEEPLTIKWQKTETLFDTRIAAADDSLIFSTSTERNDWLPSIPNYSYALTQINVQVPVVQVGAMQRLTADQALAAAASGTAIVRASCSHAAVQELAM